MFTRLEFGSHNKNGLMVPTEAVIYTGTRNVVILADAESRFRPIDVEVGRDSGDLTEIRKELQAGQRVGATVQFLYHSEASLNTTLDLMHAPESAASEERS